MVLLISGTIFGAIKPALRLLDNFTGLYFIADYHALTTIHYAHELRELTYEAAAAWLALGLDPNRAIFYRQSDIPELFELNWILSCFTPKGLLNRAHAYKAIVDRNLAEHKSPDYGINAGLYNYPVLMAADILLFAAKVIPVGPDQLQHLEIAREIAATFNRSYGEILTLPEALIDEGVVTLPGLDGRKMSKSYRNTIPIFLSGDSLRKLVMKIRTDSARPEEPKDPDRCTVFQIFRHFAPADAVTRRRRQYIEGGLAYSDIKQELYEVLERTFSDARQHYGELLANRKYIDDVLRHGGEKARRIAQPLLSTVRRAIGAGPSAG